MKRIVVLQDGTVYVDEQGAWVPPTLTWGDKGRVVTVRLKAHITGLSVADIPVYVEPKP